MIFPDHIAIGTLWWIRGRVLRVSNNFTIFRRRKDMAIYEGAGVALITPFKANGEVNYDKLEEIVEEPDRRRYRCHCCLRYNR